jgi:hypothetical protein
MVRMRFAYASMPVASADAIKARPARGSLSRWIALPCSSRQATKRLSSATYVTMRPVPQTAGPIPKPRATHAPVDKRRHRAGLGSYRRIRRIRQGIADAIVNVVGIFRLVASIESKSLHHEERRNRCDKRPRLTSNFNGKSKVGCLLGCLRGGTYSTPRGCLCLGRGNARSNAAGRQLSRARRCTIVLHVFKHSRQRLLRSFQVGQHRCRHGGGLAPL